MGNWRKLTEDRIRAAEAKGELSGLQGEGKPLPHRPEEALIDAGTAVGHRIMAEAGALPEEVVLRKALVEAKAEWARLRGTADEKEAMARVAELSQKLAIAEEARRAFFR